MGILLVLTLFILIGVAAKESTERESLSFVYVGRTHHFVIKTNHNTKHYKCYVVTLTHDEIQHVHTDAGMEAIELKYIRMIVVAKPTTSDQLANPDRQVCESRLSPNATVEWFTL